MKEMVYRMKERVDSVHESEQKSLDSKKRLDYEQEMLMYSNNISVYIHRRCHLSPRHF
jgi:hypothetical protein